MPFSIRKTHAQFMIDFEEKQPLLFAKLKIKAEYKTAFTPILVETKYGECLITPDNLLRGHFPSITTATNPTKYFINQCKEIHGDLYDYSLVKYVNSKTKVEVISEYGSFLISPNNHLNGNGCPFLGKMLSSYSDSDWVKIANKSKNFESFKVYILKCWNDDKSEIFYKIGKTFVKTKRRYSGKDKMPYNYEIIKEIISDDGLYICKLERELFKRYKEFLYKPLVFFGGRLESFKEIPNLYIPRQLI